MPETIHPETIDSPNNNSVRFISRPWPEELLLIDDLMRDLSLHSDPQTVALMYGKRLRNIGLVQFDEWLSISHRTLTRPQYKITRNSRWKESINPWKNFASLPLYTSGLLGELLYANKPTVLHNLATHFSPDDPLADQLSGFDLLVTLPMYDGGESLNMQVLLLRDAADFKFDRLPILVWQANLWGRAVSNLVLRQELQEAFVKLKSAHTALDREMKIVGQVQRSLLPPDTAELPGLDVAVHYETSQRAGGDYYDFFRQSDGSYGILIADVSGHGAAAAVLMAVTHSLAQLHPGAGCPPAELLGFLNSHLATKYTLDTGSFVTAFYGLLDPVRRTLRYANAGHPHPRIIRHRGGTLETLRLRATGGYPLGIDQSEQYLETVIQLEPGDKLVLYTDGVTEARSAEGDLFGTDRLDLSLGEKPSSAAPGSLGTIQSLLTAVKAFAGDRKLDDDQTIVVLGL